MAKWAEVEEMFNSIDAELGGTPIMLMKPKEYEKWTDTKLGSSSGMAGAMVNVITVAKSMPTQTTKHGAPLSNEKDNFRLALWHEVGHCLFPKKPHWWIDCFGAKMSKYPEEYLPRFNISGSEGEKGIGGGKHSQKYRHSLDELPSREGLLAMARNRVEESKAKAHGDLSDYSTWGGSKPTGQAKIVVTKADQSKKRPTKRTPRGSATTNPPKPRKNKAKQRGPGLLLRSGRIVKQPKGTII